MASYNRFRVIDPWTNKPVGKVYHSYRTGRASAKRMADKEKMVVALNYSKLFPGTNHETFVSSEGITPRGYGEGRNLVGSTGNPVSVIPRSWKQAKVRRLKDGRVQVMISGSSRNPKPLRVIKVTPPYDWGAGKGGKSWIIVDSEGKQVSGFYKTKKIAESFKRRK